MSFRQHVRAPRTAVYRALGDGSAIERWRCPCHGRFVTLVPGLGWTMALRKLAALVTARA